MVLAGARMPATGEHRGPFGLSTWKPPPSRDEWGLLRSKPPVPGCLLHLVSSTWLPLVAHSCRFLFSSLWSRELNYLHLLWILKYLACFLLSYSVSGFMFLHILCLVFFASAYFMSSRLFLYISFFLASNGLTLLYSSIPNYYFGFLTLFHFK